MKTANAVVQPDRCACSDRTGEAAARGRDLLLDLLRKFGNWEFAPSQARINNTDELPTWEWDADQAAAAAATDPTWHSADGTRYEALFVTDTGATYGRIGPAPRAEIPNAENLFGASRPAPSRSTNDPFIPGDIKGNTEQKFEGFAVQGHARA